MGNEKEEKMISESEVNTRVAMATMSTRMDQLEKMQKAVFEKTDALVDSMKLMVKEMTTNHQEHISQAYVTKDTYYQREESLKEEFEQDLNGVTEKFEKSNNEQNEQINKLKLRVTQLFTAAFVIYGSIQFTVKFLM